MNLLSILINFLLKNIETEQSDVSSTEKVPSEELNASLVDEIVEALSVYLRSQKLDKHAMTISLLFEHEIEKNSINQLEHLEYISQQVKLQSGFDIALDAVSATAEQWNDDNKYPKLLPTVALCVMQNSPTATHNVCATLTPLEEYADRVTQPSFVLNTSSLTANLQFFLIGRGEHPRTRNGTPRMNDVVIVDGLNQVSRAHARIGYDQRNNVFYIKADKGGVDSGTCVCHRDSSNWNVLSSTQARINLLNEDVIELGGEDGVQLLFKLQ